ncbi:radical SAM protein [Paracoccus sp. TK19116]|uniref:Radical SAM protein n=1 Tax=Paracoccus albicereus TaxID=2922394 RepID=A0ABT1MML0_9RHOB|nr:radical SAM protein [Paracoccus albicereus]
MSVGRLHLGGGTPTILSADRIDRLAGWLEQSFTLAPGHEVSVEIDPCDCDTARLDALVRMGLSRVSVGVQDFDPLVQKAIGRLQSLEVTHSLVGNARMRGISSINVDLVYGLPFQTEDTMRRTLDHIVAMRPERLALFGYAHVPWMAQRQRLISENDLPDPEARLHLAAVARNVLVAEGYEEVGIDHFALPEDELAIAASQGTLRRNFQGYTTDDARALIGLGPSAISSFAQGTAQNVAATGEWQRRTAAGQLATARGHRSSPLDKVAASVIERLMCDGRIDLKSVAIRHDIDIEYLKRRARTAIDELPGIGSLDENMLRSGSRETVRILAAYFDPGFAHHEGAYSQAS